MGFTFNADMKQFARHLAHMSFYKEIPNLLDISEFYRGLFPEYKTEGGYSLARVCDRVLTQKLCKEEQMSNWERRPLRKSQIHYAALDAWILVHLCEQLDKLTANKENLDKEQFVKVISRDSIPAKDEVEIPDDKLQEMSDQINLAMDDEDDSEE